MAAVIECGICLIHQSSNEDDYFCATTCGHVFHFHCIRQWHIDSPPPRCPICMNSSNMSQNKLIKLYGINAPHEYKKQMETNLKLVLIGDTGTGKSSLLRSFTDGMCIENAETTIGSEMRFKVLNFAGLTIGLTLWDCAGQDRFRAITPNYIRNSHGVCIIYDVTRAKTLENLNTWLKIVYTSAPPKVTIMLVGNKLDLEGSKQVTTDRGQEIARSHGIDFIETSAKSLVNVEATFRLLVGKILENYMKNGLIDIHPESGSVRLHVPNTSHSDETRQRCAC